MKAWHARLAPDTATRHRIAAVFALALAAAAIIAMSGAFVLLPTTLSVQPLVKPELLPDGQWAAQWLAGSVSAAEQQGAAVDQWLHVILVFGVLTAAIGLANALVGLLSYANDRRYESALRGLVGAPAAMLRWQYRKGAIVNALLGIAVGAPCGLAFGIVLQRMWHGQHQAQHASWLWSLVGLLGCAAVAIWAARIATKRFRRAGWMGDALTPEARTLPGYGAEDLRALLTAGQIAGAVALTTVGLLVWSYIQHPKTTGWHPAGNQYIAHVHHSKSIASLLQQVRATEGIEAESIATPGALLGIGRIDKVVSWCGRCVRANMFTPLFPVETQQHVVGRGFFDVAGIRVELGREFTGARDDAQSIVVNASFAQIAFDDPNPIGKRVTVGGMPGRTYRVIGVVEDIPTRGLQSLEPEAGALAAQTPTPNTPAIYFSADAHAPANFDIIVKAAQPPVALAGLGFEPVASLFERAEAPHQWFARVVALFGILLCAIAAVGTLSASMLSVESRRAEIALRRAVGARRRDVRRLVLMHIGGTVLRGAAFGLVLSLALARAIEPFVPGLPVLNLRSALLVVVVVALTALAAGFIALQSALTQGPAN